MPVAERPPLPREHGAWGILLVPFATAIGVAGRWNWPVTLLLVSVLAFYVARTSWLKRQWRWVAGLLTLSVAAALPLVVAWKMWWLPVFAVVALPVAVRPTGRSTGGQLAGAVGLTLTAPAAWYVATGRLDGMAAGLWGANAAYFAGGVLYVRMHLEAARRLPGARTVNVAYHAVLTGFVLALGIAGVISWGVAAAFAPAVVRALIGSWRLGPELRLKRLGWTEVAHSVVFSGLLAWALRT
jgi:hypothetical protein